MAQTKPGLEIRNLVRCFGGRRVVDDVSLNVLPGQITCLLGPSGCGKSTILRLIAGVDHQDAGEIYADGIPMSDATFCRPPEERSVGLMFQDFALFPHLSVADNVGYGLRGSRPERRTRVLEMLKRVHMDGQAQAYPHQLSGGEQQRVALARALAPRPRVMLMDEPFSGLDNRLRDGIRDETLTLLKDEDAAVLLVTHEPEEAMRMADEVALLRDGRIVQKGAPYNIYTKPVDKAAVAFFSEANVLRCRVQDALAMTPYGRFLVPGHPDGAEIDIVIRTQHVKIDFTRGDHPPAETSAQGAPARAIVRKARFLGNESLVEFSLQQTQQIVKATVPGVFLPKAGTALWLRVPREKCYIFAAL